MPNDATEAALGLLGLTGAFPSSTSTSTPTPTIPAKRKQPPPRPRSPPSPNGPDSQSSDSISCICGFSYDDGFSIGCDSCSRWSHAACFNIVENQVPDEWQCWICAPRPVDKDRAVKLQKARQRQAVSNAQSNNNATSNGRRRSSPGVERKTRRPSAVSSAQDPPNDKPAHTNKRKRRASTSLNTANNHPHPQEDEHVDIDEPWTHSYVPITKDIVPADETRDRLRRVASDWRGVSAINGNDNPHTPGSTTPALLTPDDIPYASPASLCPPQISISPLHGPAAGSVWPGLYANGSGSHSVRPPSYAVHANKPIQSSKLIAPYPSTIIPTAMYLRDPLNAYAHLGMPKPYVHLFGPPLDVALDSRITGDQSRFVRSGCKPNAILRPIFCGAHGKKAGKDEREDEAITFGIFALRDLKPNEEVVLGWEWDDDNVVHHLPALLQSPFTFPPHQLQHFRNQMRSMLHSLASTFTTCACGAKAHDCVLTRIAEFVEHQTPLTPSPSPPSLFSKEKEKHAGKSRKSDRAEASPAPVDVGPLVGIERGFRTRERIPSSGGMGGVEMVPPSPCAEAGPSRLTSDTPRRVSFPDDLLKKAKGRKGKTRADEEGGSDGQGEDGQGPPHARRPSGASSDPEAMDVDRPPREECLPPRLRKAWIAKSLERLREQRGGGTMSPASSSGGGESGMDSIRDESCFDSRDMPPPPVPPSRTPPTLSTALLPPPISATSSSSSTSSKQRVAIDGTTSPSVPFSKLSLLSPIVPLPLNTPVLSRPKSPTTLPTLSTSKADSKKRRRPTLSPQPPALDATPAKPAKSAKAKTIKGKEKEKEKAKERDEESEEEREKEAVKPKAKPKPKSKPAKEKEVKEKQARPSTPATESDEPVLTASIVRRGDKKTVARAKDKDKDKVKERDRGKEKARSASTELSAARSTASASATASPCIPPTSLGPLSSPGPPPTTPVIVLPELPPEPPDKTRWSVALKAPDTVDENQVPDAMDVDRPPASTPKASPAVSARSLSTPPVACRDLPTLPSSSPAASPVVVKAALLPPPPLTARSPSPPPTPPPAPLPPEPVAVEPASSPQDAMAVDESVADKGAVLSLPPPEPEPRPDSEAVSDRHSSPAPQESEREAESQGPPPPAKVKLSLKDFALRKKKQREEQQEREKEKVGAQSESESPRIPMSSPALEPDIPATTTATATEVRSSDLRGLGIVNGDPDGDVKMAEEAKDVGPEVTAAEDVKELDEPLPRLTVNPACPDVHPEHQRIGRERKYRVKDSNRGPRRETRLVLRAALPDRSLTPPAASHSTRARRVCLAAAGGPSSCLQRPPADVNDIGSQNAMEDHLEQGRSAGVRRAIFSRRNQLSERRSSHSLQKSRTCPPVLTHLQASSSPSTTVWTREPDALQEDRQALQRTSPDVSMVRHAAAP
ncbi:hypothetical protein LXA43DRAFT_1103459 [Ganoderma leucocontextum]|nr:hypothetical protein LXA43DRAFT_1103459 [Ganoderma leucocontextum]